MIPATYLETLKERLIITFKPPAGRSKRSKIPRSNREYRVRYRAKKAHQVYLEILEDYPHIYIPFILAVSPESCECFDLEEFRQKHDLSGTIKLKHDVKNTWKT
jgi:hypothetical protein